MPGALERPNAGFETLHSLTQARNTCWEAGCTGAKSIGFGNKEAWILILFVPLISMLAKCIHLHLLFPVGKMEIFSICFLIFLCRVDEIVYMEELK